jgi:uncharacterized membrane protein YhaH (DUF805 family)
VIRLHFGLVGTRLWRDAALAARQGGFTVGFAEAIKTVLRKYAKFSGRARRSEYWFWTLAVVLGYLVTSILALVAKPFVILTIIFYLGIIVPSLAVGVRRLQDTGKSGLYLLFNLIPFVGFIVVLILTIADSTPGDNKYGPNPKGVGGLGMPPVGYGIPPVA